MYKQPYRGSRRHCKQNFWGPTNRPIQDGHTLRTGCELVEQKEYSKAQLRNIQLSIPEDTQVKFSEKNNVNKLKVNTEFLHFNANMLPGSQRSSSVWQLCSCIMWFHFVVVSLVTIYIFFFFSQAACHEKLNGC